MGGTESYTKYLKDHLSYPDEAFKQKIEGKVYIQFVVDVNGEIIETKIVKGVHPLLDQHALEIVKNMPAWNPARIDGKPIKSRFVIPINFKK